jgi:hypothetical protein
MDPALALQQAMQQMSAMHAELQRIQGHNQGLQSQLDATSAASAAAAVRRSEHDGQVFDRNLPKIPSPVPFIGVTGPAVEEFINSVDRQFDYYVTSFAKEDTRLRYVVNYLQGKAASWYSSSKMELASITTWAEFKTALRARFQPIGSADIARESLDRSQQTGSVASYTEHFYRCMTYIKDMSDAHQVHQYRRGLKKEIRQEVIREQPSTIAEAVNIAHRAESFLNLGTSRPFTTSNGRSFVPRYAAASSNGSSGSSAMMDINNIELDPNASELAEDHADHRGESTRFQQLTE